MQNVTEVRHGFKESDSDPCPACGASRLKRIFNPAGIVFKGSGFYVTDSRKSSGGRRRRRRRRPRPTPRPKATPRRRRDAAPKADSAPKKSESSAA